MEPVLAVIGAGDISRFHFAADRLAGVTRGRGPRSSYQPGAVKGGGAGFGGGASGAAGPGAGVGFVAAGAPFFGSPFFGSPAAVPDRARMRGVVEVSRCVLRSRISMLSEPIRTRVVR
jgi:hypothetical protein